MKKNKNLIFDEEKSLYSIKKRIIDNLIDKINKLDYRISNVKIKHLKNN